MKISELLQSLTSLKDLQLFCGYFNNLGVLDFFIFRVVEKNVDFEENLFIPTLKKILPVLRTFNFGVIMMKK